MRNERPLAWGEQSLRKTHEGAGGEEGFEEGASIQTHGTWGGRREEGESTTDAWGADGEDGIEEGVFTQPRKKADT